MDVLVLPERLDQTLVTGYMRENPQLNLRVVGRNQRSSRMRRPKPASDVAAHRGTNRNVLQIRVRAGKPAGSRNRLVERSMDLPRLGVNQPRKGFHVGREEFLQLPVLQHPVDDGLSFHFLQRGGVRRVTRFCPGNPFHADFFVKLELVVNHLSQLPRRADVERFTRKLVDLFFQLLPSGPRTDPACSSTFRRQGRFPAPPSSEAPRSAAFPTCLKQLVDLALLHLLPQDAHQAESEIGVLAGVLTQRLNRYLGHGDLVAALADDVRGFDLGVLEILQTPAHPVSGSRPTVPSNNARPSCRNETLLGEGEPALAPARGDRI